MRTYTIYLFFGMNPFFCHFCVACMRPPNPSFFLRHAFFAHSVVAPVVPPGVADLCALTPGRPVGPLRHRARLIQANGASFNVFLINLTLLLPTLFAEIKPTQKVKSYLKLWQWVAMTLPLHSLCSDYFFFNWNGHSDYRACSLQASVTLVPCGLGVQSWGKEQSTYSGLVMHSPKNRHIVALALFNVQGYRIRQLQLTPVQCSV